MTGWSVLMSEIAPSTKRPPGTGFSAAAPVGAADSCAAWGADGPHAVATKRTAPRMLTNRFTGSLLDPNVSPDLVRIRPALQTGSARRDSSGGPASGAREIRQAEEVLEGAHDAIGAGVAGRLALG